MTERNGNQEKTFALPPLWCGSICRNSMNEICVENCAIKRDCSAFEPKPNLKLEDMPRFPLQESGSMTREEKFTSVTIYLSKVVDHLQGVQDERIPERRHQIRHAKPTADSIGSGPLSEGPQIKDILPHPEEGSSTHPNGEKSEDQMVGSDIVVDTGK